MKRIIITFLFISVSIFTNGQNHDVSETNEKTGLSEIEFLKAKDDYLKMTQTEIYKANKVAMMKLIKKLNSNKIAKEFLDEIQWSNWISENLANTKFKSVDEAIELRKLNLELTKKQYEENAEIYAILKRATIEQRIEILKPERLPRPF